MKVCEINYLYAEDTAEETKKGGEALAADYASVATDIFAKLINTKEHLNELASIPNRSVLDLSLIAYCFENNDPDGSEIPVTGEMLKAWNISEDKLFEDAVRNTRALMGEKVSPMHEVINELLGSIDSLQPEIEEDRAMPMYVFSNLWRWNGALCMLFSDTLQEMADMLGSDLYVIPSSIHEVILVPVGKGICRGELDNMVREINRTELKPEDVLSDHTYIFLRKLGKVIL